MDHVTSNEPLPPRISIQRRMSGDTSSTSGNEETGFMHEKIRPKAKWWKDVYRPLAGSERRSSAVRLAVFSTTLLIAIVSIILLIYFNITLRRQIPHNDIQRMIESWGKPGTRTERQSTFPTDFSRDIIPRPCHSHNDYTRNVPLYDALNAGCTSVEADVWLTSDNADLLVGHTQDSLSSDRSLKSLYINPLLDILAHQNPQNPLTVNSSASSSTSNTNPPTLNGVFDVNVTTSLTLLIDIKTSGLSTFPSLLAELEPLRSAGYLTHFNGTSIIPGPLTIVGTGATPFSLLTANSTYRSIFFDAPLSDLWGEDAPSNNKKYTSQNSDFASTNFEEAIGKTFLGVLSPSQVEVIRGQVAEARRRGLRARYWGTPSWPLSLRDHVWDVLEKEGVGMLNVDDLEAATKRSWGE